MRIRASLGSGKYARGIGAVYTTERTHVEYFDERIRDVHDAVADHLGSNLEVWFVDESWDRRFYLVYANGDVDSGAWYRYDAEKDTLAMITRSFPWIEERVELSEMRPISYPAPDGVSIPGYLTLPASGGGARPLVVLPHGGPRARDRWGFDFLVQYLASQGYAVLQANYRGSDGYGKEWIGRGAFNDWKTVVSDLDAGISHLVAEGVADPERVCIVGWSFGGYASLIAAIEHPERFQCAVSIAPVTHPYEIYRDVQQTVKARRYMKAFVPQDPESVRLSSPLRRVEELAVPALVVHG